MACGFDPDDVELGLAVELPSVETDTWVRLWHRRDPWGDDSIHVCVEIGSAELSATAHDLTLAVRGENLTPFLDTLAADFAGWSGTRTWDTLDHDLRIDAQWRSGGHVELVWTLTPWRHDVPWTASVRTTHEAGETLQRLAAAVYRFLWPDA